MPANEDDRSLRLSPEAVRNRSFSMVRRGYDPDQVRDYLHEVADELKRILGELGAPRPPAPVPRRGPDTDPYQEVARRLAGFLKAADREAIFLRHDAMEEADRILAEARAEAERIRYEARVSAEDQKARRGPAVHDAEIASEEVLADLEARRDALVEQLTAMQASLLGEAVDMESASRLLGGPA